MTSDGAWMAQGMPARLTDANRIAEAQLRLAECQQRLEPVAAEPKGMAWLAGRVTTLLAHGSGKEPALAPAVAEALAVDWLRALSRYPRWAIEEAAMDYILTQRWRPAVADISTRCEALIAGIKLDARQLAAMVGE